MNTCNAFKNTFKFIETTKPATYLQETGCGTGKVRELPCIGNCFDSAYKLPLPCQKAINPGS